MGKASKPDKVDKRDRRDRGGRRGNRRLAVTSGEAARYCLVSPGTIVNWITAGDLSAQRTRGGQYRILVEDLRSFMAAHGMSRDLMYHELELTPCCWEFWASLDRTGQRSVEPAATCQECPVYRSGKGGCHEIRPMLPSGTLRAPSCTDCLFLQTVRGVEGDERR